MGTIIRICDKNGNKYSGFELSKRENIVKLFPYGVKVDSKFNIGNEDYIVKNIAIDGFYKGKDIRGTLDDPNNKLGTFIWISCETHDKRIMEGRSEDDLISIANDLGIRPFYLY